MDCVNKTPYLFIVNTQTSQRIDQEEGLKTGQGENAHQKLFLVLEKLFHRFIFALNINECPLHHPIGHKLLNINGSFKFQGVIGMSQNSLKSVKKKTTLL